MEIKILKTWKGTKAEEMQRKNALKVANANNLKIFETIINGHIFLNLK